MNKQRRPLIAGNWKMFKGGPAGVELAAQCAKLAKEVPSTDLLIAPPFTVLAAVAHECAESGVRLAGQNMHVKDSGAFTGEISGTMLMESGCTWVILGHSERRHHFGETDAFVAEKVAAAIAGHLTPIVCVGETLAEREGGRTLQVVERQLRAFLPALGAATRPGAIAYEPVWAIGTGMNAGSEEAQEVHAAIRRWLSEASAELATATRILYGGSVKADNARALLAAPDVDGALVGGASLEAESFAGIVRAAEGLAAR